MERRIPMAIAALAVAGVMLAGCVPQGPATPTESPTPTSGTPSPSPSRTSTPSPTPTPTPTPSPTPTPTPTTAPVAPMDPDAVIAGVIMRDAAAVIAQLGDPIREVDLFGGSETVRSAAEATADLANILGTGEPFKPGQPSDAAATLGDEYPEFAADDAVVLVGSMGTVLSFIPGAFLRVAGS